MSVALSAENNDFAMPVDTLCVLEYAWVYRQLRLLARVHNKEVADYLGSLRIIEAFYIKEP